MERIEGDDPSGIGIESPNPSEYTLELLFVIYVTSFPHLFVKLKKERLGDDPGHIFLVTLQNRELVGQLAGLSVKHPQDSTTELAT